MFKTFTAAVFATTVATAAMAEDTLKSSEFLTWTIENQRGYINTAANAAFVIAGFNKEAQSKCIAQWIVDNRPTGYKPVIDAMKGLPNYHPMGVTIAVIQKACGPFKYSTASAALQ